MQNVTADLILFRFRIPESFVPWTQQYQKLNWFGK